MFTERDEAFMRHAMQLAERAAQEEEVPVGAVLTFNDEVIGEGWNRPIGLADPTAHAEVMALRAGADKMKNYRLPQTTLYVTLEPCVMCLGALVHARVARVVFGAFDPKGGAVESVFNLGKASEFNHNIHFQGGLLNEQCGALLKQFFKARR
jgi:tRNA(adenine34) deaminase